MPRPLLACVAILLVQCLVALPVRADAGVPDPARLKAHMAFLADDLLEGRETGTRGYDIAARYVATQFQQMGLKPAGDAGGFLQAVPLRGGSVVPGAAVFEIRRSAGTEALLNLRDFLMGPRLFADQVDVTAPMVFVGHGITAPRFGHDDYAGIDVRGKIVVHLGGSPRHFPGEEAAHYASGLTKSRLAARHGAVATVALQSPDDEQRLPFARVAVFNGQRSIDWVTADGRGSRDVPGLRGGAYVSTGAAAKLFAGSGVTADAVFAADQAGQPLPRLDLGVSARLAQATQRTDLSSANVVGVVEGSDPTLRSEYVVFSAHLDALGVQPSIGRDNILNGAMDNAAGVAALLELARLTAAMPVKPKRSMLFVAVTGEEKGLTGSSYFATLPTVPKAAMVANVNLDMPNLLLDFSDVVAFGAERSSLQAAVARAAAAVGVALTPDPDPQQALFIRSDHYSFVQQGVPSVYITTGKGSFDPAQDGRTLDERFMREHWHQASDDMTLPFHWGAAVRFARLNQLLGLDIANTPQRPRWNEGDFFGELFGNMPATR